MHSNRKPIILLNILKEAQKMKAISSTVTKSTLHGTDTYSEVSHFCFAICSGLSFFFDSILSLF